MATIKLVDLAYCLVFSVSQTRSSGAWAPDMGYVMQQNACLVKPYLYHKTGRFRIFLSIFGSHTRIVGAGAPDMGHVIHQNYRLVEAYRDHKKKLTKSVFLTMATLKLDDYVRIYFLLWLPIRVWLLSNRNSLSFTIYPCIITHMTQ